MPFGTPLIAKPLDCQLFLVWRIAETRMKRFSIPNLNFAEIYERAVSPAQMLCLKRGT